MATRDGQKTGGRTAGTPNKATREVKDFLARVWARAFSETVTIREEVPDGDGVKVVERVVSLEDQLVEQLITLTINESLFRTLLAYYAGTPRQQVDVKHGGTVTLAQLVAGTAPISDDEQEASAPPAGVH